MCIRDRCETITLEVAEMAENNTSNIGFEKQIWDAACVLRGNIDASEYKSVVLGLIFLKYISDQMCIRDRVCLPVQQTWRDSIRMYDRECPGCSHARSSECW